MLLTIIALYLLLTLAIGTYMARRVRTTEDYLLAGRRLGLPMATFTVFATWFGSETLLGSSAAFAEQGLYGIIEDPLSAALGLIIVGGLFARRLYRLQLLTISDFYGRQFGATAERLSAVFMAASFVGWIAAQMVAMGFVLHSVTGLSEATAIAIASAIVMGYTFFGGMWAVSATDFLQTLVIVVGLGAVLWQVIPKTGGWESLTEGTPKDFFRILPPENSVKEWLAYVAAWLTLGVGSIPSQDIYQRVVSSRSERIAVWSSWLAGGMYLTVGLIPSVMALAAKRLQTTTADPQQLVLQLVLQHTDFAVQALFFGALVSAIMSTASGAILALAATISQNLLLPLWRGNLSDTRHLLVSRASVVLATLTALLMALYRRDIYQLVSEASAVGLVSLLVPLLAGLYWSSKNQRAAVASMLAGSCIYIACRVLGSETLPPALAGLTASAGGFFAVSVCVGKGGASS